jgi:hypothetical protein
MPSSEYIINPSELATATNFPFPNVTDVHDAVTAPLVFVNQSIPFVEYMTGYVPLFDTATYLPFPCAADDQVVTGANVVG